MGAFAILPRPGVLAGFVVALLLLAASAIAGELITPPGSGFGLVPPDGFVLSQRFSGFEDTVAGSTILLAQLDKDAYAQLEKATVADLSGDGVAFTDRTPFAAGSVEGLLFVGMQQVAGATVRKWTFIFPAQSFTGMATVSVSAATASDDTDAAVRTALGSIVVGPQVSVAEAVKALPFTLAETDTLKFVRTMGGGAVGLTAGSKDVDPERSQPWLVISASAGNACPGDPRETAEMLLRQRTSLDEVKIQGTQDLPVSDGPGIEIVADALDAASRVPLRVVQRVGPFDGRDCLVLVGKVRPEQADAAVPEFRKVMDTVRLKTP